MASCDLRVVVDKPDRTFAVGEKITGAVEVRVNAECACNRLALAWGWRTHGKGNTAMGGGGEIELFRGKWMPGERFSYEFAIDAPRGPLTYHGNYLNVDWYLTARADIPWALDPKAEEEVLIVAGKGGGALDLGPEYKPPAAAAKHATAGAGCGIVFGVLFGGVGAVALLISLVSLAHSWGAIIGVIVGAVFTLIGGLIVFAALRNTLAQRKLGPVDARAKPDIVHPGGTVVCQLGFSPQGVVDLARVTATLVGKEEVVSGSGTDRTTHTNQLHGEELTLESARRLSPGEVVTLEGTLHLPPDAPITFAASDNHVTWLVKVHIEITGWPDWKHELPITVLP
jgi:hypothetical protein